MTKSNKLSLTVFTLLTVFSAASANFIGGGITEIDGVPGSVQDIAQWAINKLEAYTGVSGQYYLLRVHNVKTQTVAGITYYFTTDSMVSTGAIPAFVAHSCDVVIFDQPWTSTRQFVSEPKCVENPQLIGNERSVIENVTVTEWDGCGV
jgi:hypothetical protein